MLTKDKFLSETLGKPAWRVERLEEITQERFRRGQNGFVYAKVDCTDIAAITTLGKLGFSLIEVNVQYDRGNAGPWAPVDLPAGYGVRFAKTPDAVDVEKIAETSFVHTRFHVDPLISNDRADNIKCQWAANYFKKKRGDWMIVLTYRGATVGFLQLFLRNFTICVDLIAVEERHQNNGFSGKMIEFAGTQRAAWNRMLVGTQLSNVASIRAYEKLGFRLCGSSFVLHYHGPVNT